MLKTSPFVSAEDGAITVDWVVLTAIGSAVAMATVGVLSGGVKGMNQQVEIHLGNTSTVSTTWAEAMRNYDPYDDGIYQAIYGDLSSLSEADLDIMEAYFNDVAATLGEEAETEAEYGLINDVSFAVGLVYVDRVRGRPGGTEADAAEIARIADQLGWSDEALAFTN